MPAVMDRGDAIQEPAVRAIGLALDHHHDAGRAQAQEIALLRQRQPSGQLLDAMIEDEAGALQFAIEREIRLRDERRR